MRGGLVSMITEHLASIGSHLPVVKLGTPADQRVHHGSVSQLRRDCGYDAEGIKNAIRNLHNTLAK